jgi:TonB family protein
MADPLAPTPPSPTSPAAPTKRRGRWRRRFVYFVLTLLVLVAVAPLALGLAPVRRMVAEKVSAAVGRKVTIGGISAAGCATPDSPAPQRSIGELVLPQQAWSADTDRTTDDAPAPAPALPPELTGVIVDPGELTLEDTEAHNGAYRFPEVMPEFPGGHDSLYAFMKKHLRYPDRESERKIHGKVYVEFVIDTDGRATRSRIIRGVENGAGFDAEVLRVIDLMPSWTPGRKGERAVPTRLVLPVHFAL